MFAGKPIIGISGGIGSGKSFVAALFGELGCLVVDSDQQAADAYREPGVIETLRQWWGDGVSNAAGELDKRFIATKVFSDARERQRLEGLIHPLVNAARERVMRAASGNPDVLAFVWDTPLLFETGLNAQCDAVVFVDAPPQVRLARVRQHRDWDAGELARREISQWPLDSKREISDYVVENTADAGLTRGQVRDVLTRILAKHQQRP